MRTNDFLECKLRFLLLIYNCLLYLGRGVNNQIEKGIYVLYRFSANQTSPSRNQLSVMTLMIPPRKKKLVKI